ncbi:hypothetical protein V1264_014240 [Littorina saxatilis]|uniref:Uncharacterized protein n=1 Tax=Littorina saxatilis TaxID=31220 RepID=A0AAN9BRV8_9CAEN
MKDSDNNNTTLSIIMKNPSPTNGPRKRTESREVQEIRVVIKDDDDVNVEYEDNDHVIYRVHDTPPVYMWPVYGMQQPIAMPY